MKLHMQPPYYIPPHAGFHILFSSYNKTWLTCTGHFDMTCDNGEVEDVEHFLMNWPVGEGEADGQDWGN